MRHRGFGYDGLKFHVGFGPKGIYVFWGNVCGSFRAVVTNVAFLAFLWTPGSQASGLTCSWSGPEEFLISSLIRRVPKVSQSLHPGWGPCDAP